MGTILQEILEEYGQKDKCKIRNPEHVQDVLHQLVHDGFNKLQVIADFDFTLTRFHKDGVRCQSAHGVLDYSTLMSEEYRKKAQAIFAEYYPREIDPNLTNEEKAPIVIEWFRKCQKLIMEHKLSKAQLHQMVKDSSAFMRDLVPEVLSCLNEHEIPVLVFSAGEGDLIEELLHRDKCFFPNIKVLSNYMIFDDDGVCVGFKEPLIHIYNKTQAALDNRDYFQGISHRNNALLLGDSHGDAKMDVGLQNPGAVLKIGFLNDKIEERMNSFQDIYDVVLVDDQTFKFVDLIIKKILSTAPAKDN